MHKRMPPDSPSSSSGPAGPLPTLSHKPWNFSSLEPGEDCRRGLGLLNYRSLTWTDFDLLVGGSNMSCSQLEAPWYQEGLSFECTRCGACCTGAPGYVWVSHAEIKRLAEFRGQTVDQFSSRFVRRVGTRYSLVERPGGDCIFWDAEVGCTVYPARPLQCQAWPFWPENVETPDDWAQITRVCPGAGQGRLYSIEEIQASIAMVRK
jgi:uncharacterized protein